MKRHFSILGLIVFLLFITNLAISQGLPITKPENVGFSSERLNRIKPFMQEYVDQNKLPGLKNGQR